MRREFIFDDGGMNLLSSTALRKIRSELPVQATLFVFRSGRPNLFAFLANRPRRKLFTRRALFLLKNQFEDKVRLNDDDHAAAAN